MELGNLWRQPAKYWANLAANSCSIRWTYVTSCHLQRLDGKQTKCSQGRRNWISALAIITISPARVCSRNLHHANARSAWYGSSNHQWRSNIGIFRTNQTSHSCPNHSCYVSNIRSAFNGFWTSIYWHSKYIWCFERRQWWVDFSNRESTTGRPGRT